MAKLSDNEKEIVDILMNKGFTLEDNMGVITFLERDNNRVNEMLKFLKSNTRATHDEIMNELTRNIEQSYTNNNARRCLYNKR